MTDHPAQPHLDVAQLPDAAAIGRHLAKLATAYPAFAFSHELFGRKGTRWIAQRRDHIASGLTIVITDDLMELHAALLRDKARKPS